MWSSQRRSRWQNGKAAPAVHCHPRRKKQSGMRRSLRRRLAVTTTTTSTGDSARWTWPSEMLRRPPRPSAVAKACLGSLRRWVKRNERPGFIRHDVRRLVGPTRWVAPGQPRAGPQWIAPPKPYLNRGALGTPKVLAPCGRTQTAEEPPSILVRRYLTPATCDWPRHLSSHPCRRSCQPDARQRRRARHRSRISEDDSQPSSSRLTCPKGCSARDRIFWPTSRPLEPSTIQRLCSAMSHVWRPNRTGRARMA
mmetsp:Transcript_117553/g.332576  ORF Transcript_117553/g.332576 Transcript_117553/m.332576 type:complete len:252 (-) Transcript_117553:639-1394(-)